LRVPMATIRSGTPAPRPVTRRAGRRPPPFNILYVGQFWEWKGVDVLVRALALLPEAFHLRLVGGEPGGDRVAALRRLIDSLGVSQRVSLRGFVPHRDLAALYQEADCVVLPNPRSVRAAFCSSPIKLFEYMASGVPIVATRLVSTTEVLRDGIDAVLVAPDAPEELAAGIRQVAEHPEMAAALAQSAVTRAAAFTWEARAAALVGFLEPLVAD